ncbi:MAG: DNA-binding response regulator [Chloroflexi bacterium]|nr:MAG: DNA-binding response regulator [Chloroflexota bacterium]
MNSIRVLVAKDHPVTQEGICAILETTGDLKPVGVAANGQEALALAQKYQPDVLLLDLKMPGPAPVELVAVLRHCCSGTKVLVLSAYCDEANVQELVKAGVSGCMDKIEAPENLVEAIRAVAGGDAWFSQAMLKQLEKGDELAPAQDADLTGRELAVLRLVAAGKTNREIGLALKISDKTVEKHLAGVYKKLGVGSRVEAVVWAVRNGLA